MKQAKVITLCGGLAVGMFGFGFAMVPLYDVFCDVMGTRLEDGDGRVTQAEAAETVMPAEDRWVTVHMDTSVDQYLPWQFAAQDKFVKVRVGELAEAMFDAMNQADYPVTGQAVPSVAPAEASIYFAKTECFCFTRQQLAGGETREMPVKFMLDPELPEDIKVVTLSYRFYPMEEEKTAALNGG